MQRGTSATGFIFFPPVVFCHGSAKAVSREERECCEALLPRVIFFGSFLWCSDLPRVRKSRVSKQTNMLRGTSATDVLFVVFSCLSLGRVELQSVSPPTILASSLPPRFPPCFFELRLVCFPLCQLCVLFRLFGISRWFGLRRVTPPWCHTSVV